MRVKTTPRLLSLLLLTFFGLGVLVATLQTGTLAPAAEAAVAGARPSGGGRSGSFQISGKVFLDSGRSGSPSQPGISGLAVNVVDLTSYRAVAPVFTDASGSYSFRATGDHQYAVSPTLPGYVATTAPSVTISALAANATANFGAVRNANHFPSLSLSFFSIASVSSHAGWLQMADYDPTRQRVTFYPWGGPSKSSINGNLVTYDTTRGFAQASAWAADNMTQLAAPSAWGRGGGCVDPTYAHAYMPPAINVTSGGQITEATLFVRADLAANLATSAAYQSFDLSTIPAPPSTYGWFTCQVAGHYVYFTPVQDQVTGKPNGNLVQYDTTKAFTDPDAWQTFDLTRVNSHAYGFQSVAYIAPYLYLVPDAGPSTLVRYNTNLPFNRASSYSAFDLTAVNARAGWFTGALVVGNKLVMVPWRNVSAKTAATIAVVYDTTRGFKNNASYQAIDVTTVDPLASGYQYGWVDNQGYVFFVPDGNFSNGVNGVQNPPFLAWNSALPFTQSSSWTAYPSVTTSGQELPSTGAAYDPATNTAWLAPWGQRITQVQETP